MTEAAQLQLHSLSPDEIEQLVFIDPLSKLPNRRFLEQRLGDLLGAQEGAALFCFIDIDRFKQANQTSHAFGDALLAAFAQRLLSALRADDFIARIGGDEFVLILRGLPPETVKTQGLIICQRLLEHLQDAFVIEQRTYQITMSMGCYPIYFPSAQGLDTLIASADSALREAKLQGGNTVVIHGEHKADLSTSVPCDAFQRDQNQQIIGVERMVPPLSDLDQWFAALEQLRVRHQSDWQAASQPFTLALDFPGSMALRQVDFVDLFMQRMHHYLSNHALEPERVCLELDESFLLQSPALFRRLCMALKAANCSLCLDHYGRPQSRLHSQSEYPFDRIKIATQLSEQVTVPASARTQIRTILSVAHELGQTPIALLSSADQTTIAELQALGCTYFQEPFLKD